MWLCIMDVYWENILPLSYDTDATMFKRAYWIARAVMILI